MCVYFVLFLNWYRVHRVHFTRCHTALRFDDNKNHIRFCVWHAEKKKKKREKCHTPKKTGTSYLSLLLHRAMHRTEAIFSPKNYVSSCQHRPGISRTGTGAVEDSLLFAQYQWSVQTSEFRMLGCIIIAAAPYLLFCVFFVMSTRCYSSAIVACGNGGMWIHAVGLLTDMRDAGCYPNVVRLATRQHGRSIPTCMIDVWSFDVWSFQLRIFVECAVSLGGCGALPRAV